MAPQQDTNEKCIDKSITWRVQAGEVGRERRYGALR